MVVRKFFKIVLAIVLGLTIIVDVMNSSSHQLNNLNKQANALRAGINALEAQGLTDWAIVAARALRSDLAKVEALMAELQAKV